MIRWLKDAAVTGVLLAISLGVPASLFIRFFRRPSSDEPVAERRD